MSLFKKIDANGLEARTVLGETRNLCFYDLETFLKYSCFVFYFADTGKWEVIEFYEGVNEYEKLLNVWETIVKDYILIGYNNARYDNFILISCIMNGEADAAYINDLSDQIINLKTLRWVQIPKGFLSYDVYNFKNAMPSLKIVGARLGGDIRESPIPFTYLGEFTSDDREEVLRYCVNDVELVAKVFATELGQTFFTMDKNANEAAMDMAVQIGCDANFPNLSYSMYSTGCDKFEELLKVYTRGSYRASVTSQLDHFKLEAVNVAVELIDMVRDMAPHYEPVIKEAFEFFYSKESLRARSESSGRDMMKYEMLLRDGVTVAFGAGGAHGAVSDAAVLVSRHGYRIIHADFASLYPSLMVAFDLYPPDLPPVMKDVFRKFYELRASYKASGDMDMANGYKPVLNSVPGRIKYQYSRMYHPATNFSICALGQMLVSALSLCMQGRLIQVDTDGVIMLCTELEFEENSDIIEEFSQRIGLKIGVDQYKWFTQENIHSYAYETMDGYVDGKGKILGGESVWDPHLEGIPSVIQNCIKYGVSARSALINHIKEFGLSRLAIVSKTTAKFHAFKYVDYEDKSEHTLSNRFMLSVPVLPEKALAAGFKPRSIVKVGNEKVSKIANFPPFVININTIYDDVPLEIIDLDYYVMFIRSKTVRINHVLGSIL